MVEEHNIQPKHHHSWSHRAVTVPHSPSQTYHGVFRPFSCFQCCFHQTFPRTHVAQCHQIYKCVAVETLLLGSLPVFQQNRIIDTCKRKRVRVCECVAHSGGIVGMFSPCAELPLCRVAANKLIASRCKRKGGRETEKNMEKKMTK